MLPIIATARARKRCRHEQRLLPLPVTEGIKAGRIAEYLAIHIGRNAASRDSLYRLKRKYCQIGTGNIKNNKFYFYMQDLINFHM